MQYDRSRTFALLLALGAAFTLVVAFSWFIPAAHAGPGEVLESYEIQCPADGNGSELALEIVMGTANENPGRDEIVVVPAEPPATVPCIFTPVQPEDDYGNGGVGLPLITDALIIRGEGIDVVIQRNPADTDLFRLLEATADLTLENVTVRHGQTPASYHGGGILAHQSLTLTNVVLTGNVSYGGGGAYVGGSLTMNRTVVGDNEARLGDPTYGGGVWVEGDLAAETVTVTGNVGADAYGAGLYVGGDAQIDGGTFVGNDGRRGAGLYADGDLTLVNSAFYSNTAESYGGGLLAVGALSVADTTFAHNQASFGGGLYLEEPAGPDVEVTGALFEHNVASTSGGGLFVLRNVEIDGSTFAGNEAAEGGGGGLITTGSIEGSLFEENIASGIGVDYAGGGLMALHDATIESSRFVGNTAPSGAGVFLAHVPPGNVSVLVNNLLVDNEAGEGAAIFAGLTTDAYENGGHAEINHNTIVRAEQNGGSAVQVVEGTANVVNNVITRHSVGLSAGPQAAVTSDYNLFFENVVRHAGVSPGANNLDGDPLFVDLSPGDYHLRGGSPAIDSGADLGVGADFDGVTRPQGDGYDRGAYEYIFPNTPPTSAADIYTTTMDVPLTVTAPGVLGNDGDADGDDLTAALAIGPDHGDLDFNADGSFTYTPATGFSGADAFIYRAADGEDVSPPTTVTLVVEPVYAVHLPAALRRN